MIFDTQTAKKLAPLVHPDIEKAIFLLLEAVLAQAEEDTYGNASATDAQLRQFQGKRAIIKELKEYRNRITDAIKREKDGSQYTVPE